MDEIVLDYSDKISDKIVIFFTINFKYDLLINDYFEFKVCI